VRLSTCIFGCIATVALAAGAAAADRRGVSPADFYALASAADPHLSPDGKLVAYTVATIDRKLNKKVTQIWMAPADGSRPPWQFTAGENASSPRWRPDGQSLAFISARHDARTGAMQRPQIWLLSMSGGEARRLSDIKSGVTALQWSPDGKRLACVAKSGGSESGKEVVDFRNYTNPEYKMDGKGYFDDRRDHIFVVDAATGTARQLTSGEQRNDSNPQWSPDGKRIAYLSERTDKPLLSNGEINVAPAESGAPVRLSAPESGLSGVRWSPDGRSLAYIGSADEVAIPKIWISPVDGGKHRLVSQSVTYPTQVEWNREGSALFFSGAFRGAHLISRLKLADGTATALVQDVATTSLDVDAEKRKMVYAAADYRHPGDIFVADLEGRNSRQVTHLNDTLLAELDVQPVERLEFKAADGLDIEGFFVKPAGWQPGKTYPMILMLHGGPNGMWGVNWNIESQAYAGRGWAVLMINMRGSSGYGEAFQRGVDKEWGGKAYEDLMTGVDFAIKKNPWVDGSRLGVTGQSFGGFMTDWIVGQTTRFKGAVTLSGISDLISVEGTRDAFYGHSRDFGGDLWENFDLYWKYSPIRNAPKVKTPTLVLHGDNDQRVPLGQGEEFFRALYHFGVTTELVIFPGEPHSLRVEPKHAVAVLEWQIYWFERYVAGNMEAWKPQPE
jgi:dipeptidyl aminopeptidase/acylaminoacyl peptidase